MESPSFEQQKNDKRRDINEKLDKYVAWARERDPCFHLAVLPTWFDRPDKKTSYNPENAKAIEKVTAFLMYELYQTLCRADNLGFRQIGELRSRNDRLLFQMYQNIIANLIENIDDIERTEAFRPEDDKS